MSSDTSEPYKKRKLDSPAAAEETEAWLDEFQKNNLVSRLDDCWSSLLAQTLACVLPADRASEGTERRRRTDRPHTGTKGSIQQDGVPASGARWPRCPSRLRALRMAAVLLSWSKILSDIEGLASCLPGATPHCPGAVLELLSRHERLTVRSVASQRAIVSTPLRHSSDEDLAALHKFTVGAFTGLLTTIDALVGERDSLLQKLQREPASPSQADLSCASCVRATLKYSAQCSDLQALATSLQLNLAQRSRDVEALSWDLEQATVDRENLRLRWENAKKAASCFCPCRCGARAVSMAEDLEDVKQLKQQLAELAKECESLRLDRDSKQQECIRLDLEVNVSEERFINSRAYKSLLLQAKNLLDKLGDERRQYKSLDKRLDKQRREHETEMKELKNKYKDREYEQQKSIKEFMKQVERLAREKDAKALEVAQLQSRIAKWDEHESEFKSQTDRLESELSDSRKKVAEHSQSIHTLKQRSEDLDRQLTEVRLQLTDRQEKVAALNQHIAELTAGLPPEPNVETRALRLQKEREDLIHKLKARDEEIHQLKSKLSEFAGKLKAEQEAFSMMHKEYDVTAAAFDKEAKKAKNLTLQVAKQDRDLAQLLSEKLGFDEERKLAAAERNAAKELLDAKDAVAGKLRKEIEAQAKLIDDYVKSVSECRARIKENEDQLARATSMYENNLKEQEETLSEKTKAIELCKALELKLAKSHEACAERAQRVQQLDQELVHAREELLKAATAENQKSTDEALNQQLARFRAMVRCSLCSSALKDVVINKCFHAFCKTCIDTNLEKRQRKCPRCKTKFGSADVKTFFWL